MLAQVDILSPLKAEEKAALAKCLTVAGLQLAQFVWCAHSSPVGANHLLVLGRFLGDQPDVFCQRQLLGML